MDYVWCMDTRNRIRTRDEYLLPNPTNDVKIKPQLSVNRLTVDAIELATLELPRVQRLIEPEWSRLYTYNGFPLFKNLGNTLHIRDCCYKYTAQIPYVLNNIEFIDQTDPSAPIFTTSSPHLLGKCLSCWDWGQDVQLVGLPVPVTVQTPVILSDTSFQITGLSPINWIPNPFTSTFGSLYYPQLPSPKYMSVVLAKGLNTSFTEQTSIVLACPVFQVIFDQDQSRFCIGINGAAIRTPEIDFLRDAVLTVTGAGSLGSLLGFTPCNHALCGKTDDDFLACASYPPYGTSYIELHAGNYASRQITKEIEKAHNTTYFKPAAVDLTKSTPSAQYMLTIGTDKGTIVTVAVPPGMYTPQALTITLSELLLTGWPDGQIEVTYEVTDHVYIFNSLSGKIFTLIFDDVALTNIAKQLGFQSFRYGSDTSYESDDPRITNQEFFTACPIQGLAARYNQTICQVDDDINAHKLSFYSRSPAPLPITGTTVDIEGVVNNLLRVTNPEQAHGFQVNDVTRLTVTGETFDIVVIEVVSGTEFIADFGTNVLPDNSIPTDSKTITPGSDSTIITIDSGNAEHNFVGGDMILFACEDIVYVGVITNVTGADTVIDFSPNDIPVSCTGTVTAPKGISLQGPITVEHVVMPTVSMFTSGNNPCSIKPLILGFGPRDVLWNGNMVTTSPFVYRLQASTYILLEMVYPCNGSAHIEHRFGDDNRTTILGKIVTLTDPFLDRFYPMKATFYTGMKLDYLQFRLLNPDHTLYKLHGHDWQATFRLYTPEKLLQ